MGVKHTNNEAELNNKYRVLKDNIKLLVIDRIRKEHQSEYEKNTDFVAEYIRDHIGFGPQKNNGNSKYKIEAIKQSLNVNPSQPPSLRFLLGLSELFDVSLDCLFKPNHSSQEEILDENKEIIEPILHNRYEKYMLNGAQFYLYFLDTERYIDIVEGELQFIKPSDENIVSTKLKLSSYNKNYLGSFEISKNSFVGQIELKSTDYTKDESINIMFIDPSIESTELLGTVGYMISQSGDPLKKPCINKVILSRKKISEKDIESRRWLQGLLNITSTGLLIEKDKFKELLETKAVNQSLKDFLKIEYKELVFIDDPALWHRRMSDSILNKKTELQELISLLRQASVSDSVFKLTEIDNILAYEFLINYDIQ